MVVCEHSFVLEYLKQLKTTPIAMQNKQQDSSGRIQQQPRFTKILTPSW